MGGAFGGSVSVGYTHNPSIGGYYIWGGAVDGAVGWLTPRGQS